MSRRESCVWHPMPEEVRRSSVQSRRASLAAGRRKSLNANEPDWDVEAPPTPFHYEYSTRENAAETEHTLHEAAAPPAKSPKGLQGAEESTLAEVTQVAIISESPSMEDEEAAAAAQPIDAAVVDSRTNRTRHTVRFHGEKWAKVLRKRRTEIEASFMEDIRDGASIMAHEAKRLKIKMNDCMEVTFVMYSDSRARQKEIHVALQNYNFPKTCQRYINFEA
ncbi:hypothetical protein LSCM1_04211 [Leishmania martiniquensis]|uniref:Flagellar attachment zone protein 1 conserved domain-containing protein n=1 Tax=Leishmania martiniquensis TaxID=1580590 RepID=A0A836GPP6_9TRYP|nr:hypothetical protein LSCM1_04211 [Leishmania martiniquensis]